MTLYMTVACTLTLALVEYVAGQGVGGGAGGAQIDLLSDGSLDSDELLQVALHVGIEMDEEGSKNLLREVTGNSAAMELSEQHLDRLQDRLQQIQVHDCP